MDLLDGDVELTEFEAIDAQSVKGVRHGANGFPFLLVKGLPGPVAKGARDCPKCEKSYDADHEGGKCENCGADLPDADASKAADTGKPEFDREAAKAAAKAIIGRKVDETPDIAGGTAVLAQIADLIIAEAQELKAGSAGEIADIQQLACAAEMIWCWRTGEEAVSSGSVMPATALMQAAMKGAIPINVALKAAGLPALDLSGDVDWTPGQWATWTAKLEEVAKAKHSAADRKKLAEAGNALSDGSYPIADEHDLKSAAILAQSGHGDVERAKRLIGRRSKELGVKNPLDDGKDDDDTAKGQIAKGDATVDTDVQGTGDLAKVVEAAVTKATAPLRDELSSVREELAKVKATPVPGGPVLSRNVQVKQPGGVASEDTAAKAALMRQKAAEATAPSDREGYLAYARELDEQARTKSA